jgi:nucleoside-triphosphatase THEP1
MLLIGILGDVGSGKTTLLSRLADWWRAEGKPLDGFVARSGERPRDGRGAARYDLEMLKDSRSLPYAVRDPALQPPYRFDPDAVRELSLWADGLGDGGQSQLMIIDEFGPVEAAGGGHMALWSRIVSSNPGVIVLAVRRGEEGVLRERLGTGFDMLIDAESPDAWETLRRACDEHPDWMRVGLYGGGAGGFESSVGAVLHGIQAPLTGLFMSSMQSVIMTYAASGLRQRRRVVWVPFISASLKALSPAGNRLRPMLAIAMQGLLYGGAVTLLGWNILGVALGGFLVGAWSAIQGVALQFLFVGSDLIRAYDSVITWGAKLLDVRTPGLLALIAGWSVACGAVSCLLTLFAWKRRQHMPGRLRDAVFRKGKGISLEGKPASRTDAMKKGLKDLSRPLFWLPVLVVVVFTLASGSPLESALWVVVRAAGIGFVLFSLVRVFDMHRFIAWLQSRGHWGPALAYRHALERIRSAEEHPPPPGKDPSSQ